MAAELQDLGGAKMMYKEVLPAGVLWWLKERGVIGCRVEILGCYCGTDNMCLS